MTALRFVKTEAGGNDLIIVDMRGQAIKNVADLAIAMCKHHFGVGGDGLLTIEMEGGTPFVRMFNPDGTEDFCGNGMRCVAAYLKQKGETVENRIVMRTPQGRHQAFVTSISDTSFQVEVELVAPRFQPADIPAKLPGGRIVEFPLQIGGETVRISVLSIGTPHAVIFSEKPVSENEFSRLSPLIERNDVFPERVSVMWCHVKNRETLEMRIWERAVGETLSCGTGTCAAVVMGNVLGYTADRVRVLTRGGSMSAVWRGEGPVRLIGPVHIVYTGEYGG